MSMTIENILTFKIQKDKCNKCLLGAIENSSTCHIMQKKEPLGGRRCSMGFIV